MAVLENIYNRLKRQTNSTNFIPQIDGLRFVAIISVVLLHVNGFVVNKVPFQFTKNPEQYGWWYHLASEGFGGHKAVLLFFVISGFILALPFAKHFWQDGKPIKLKAYFLRRLTRLEPPYILNMIAGAFLLLWFGDAYHFANISRSFTGILPSLGVCLVYLHNFFADKFQSINPVAWSLEIEVQFYILMPLLVQILRLSRRARRASLVIIIFLLTALQHYLPTNTLSLYSYLQYFLLGFLLVDLYLNGFRMNLHWLLSLLAGMGVLVAEISIVDIYTKGYYEYVFIVLLFLFCLLALTDNFWKKIFSVRPLTVIGGMCYTIYLWHDFIMSAVGNRVIAFNFSRSYPVVFLFQLTILLPIILVCSSVIFLLIERPCMDKDWPVKLWRWLRSKFGGQPLDPAVAPAEIIK